VENKEELEKYMIVIKELESTIQEQQQLLNEYNRKPGSQVKTKVFVEDQKKI